MLEIFQPFSHNERDSSFCHVPLGLLPERRRHYGSFPLNGGSVEVFYQGDGLLHEIDRCRRRVHDHNIKSVLFLLEAPHLQVLFAEEYCLKWKNLVHQLNLGISMSSTWNSCKVHFSNPSVGEWMGRITQQGYYVSIKEEVGWRQWYMGRRAA